MEAYSKDEYKQFYYLEITDWFNKSKDKLARFHVLFFIFGPMLKKNDLNPFLPIGT
jgi:hypothetical protein